MKRDWEWAIDHNVTVLLAEDLFDEMLNEVYGTVKIGSYEYDTARALKEVDPTAYRCGCADYIDSIVQEGAIYQLDDGTLIRENPDDVDGAA